jgi:CrcB protein
VALTRRDQAVLTALLATGFLGGYTTFSTYALESVLLCTDGSRRVAPTNLLGSVVAGLCAAAAGAAVAHLA